MRREKFEVFSPPPPDAEIVIRYRCNWHGARIKEIQGHFWSKALNEIIILVNGNLHHVKRRAIVSIKINS
jgi:hypothetical protein